MASGRDCDEIEAALRSPEHSEGMRGVAMLEAALDAATPDGSLSIALACTEGLAALMGRADLSAAEFRRASLRMCSLLAMDRAVWHNMSSDTFFVTLPEAPCGGIMAWARKAPDELTPDDAYSVACQMPVWCVLWGWGMTSLLPMGEGPVRPQADGEQGAVADDDAARGLAEDMKFFGRQTQCLWMSTCTHAAMAV